MFDLGEIFFTDGINQKLCLDEILSLVTKHHCGNFGNVDESDRIANLRIIRENDQTQQIVSAYNILETEVFVITTLNRKTTIRLANEY